MPNNGYFYAYVRRRSDQQQTYLGWYNFRYSVGDKWVIFLKSTLK